MALVFDQKRPIRLVSALSRLLTQCLLTLSIAIVSYWFLPLSDADAQSAACRRLSSQLASLSRGGANSAEARRFQKAVRDQQRELGKAKRLARSRGCSSKNRRGSCAARLNLVNRMERNLISLQSKLRRAKGSSNTSKQRNIRSKMRRLNCGATIKEVRAKRSSGGRKTLIEQIFGTRTIDESGASRRAKNTRKQSSTRRVRGGTHRTLCVRQCDGYYFPISFSTTKSYFGQDEDACAARCPAAATELYHHSVRGSDSEDMISYRTGTAYADQPFAFKYRNEKVEACTCGRASQTQLLELAGGSNFSDEIADGGANEDASKGVGFTFAFPKTRPDPGIYSESTINIAGKLDLKKAAELIAGQVEGTNVANAVTSKKTIRSVGPQFFPDQ